MTPQYPADQNSAVALVKRCTLKRVPELEDLVPNLLEVARRADAGLGHRLDPIGAVYEFPVARAHDLPQLLQANPRMIDSMLIHRIYDLNDHGRAMMKIII